LNCPLTIVPTRSHCDVNLQSHLISRLPKHNIVMPEPHTPESTIESAFLKLKQSVSSNDAMVFQSTTLEDVWKAAEEIERVQRQRKSLHNMKRIEPLLLALDKYSKPVDILCQGTPYLPWIWVCSVGVCHIGLRLT
jgi:hypothetical protein